jgi:WD40 repeat protein
MSKSVVINLGAGDLNSGFPRVTVQLREAGHPLPQQFTGSLPPAPVLGELYRNWQLVYKSLSARKELLSPPAREEDDDELEIDETGITNVSQLGFEDLCKKLEASLNAWLKSSDFIHIEQQLRAELNTAEEIRVIVETGDELLRRFPWHCWDFFSDYPKAEMALSRPEYKRTQPSQPKAPREKVRILAVIGNSSGINLEAESRFLKNLPDAEVEFLVKPSRQELNTQLWNDRGWDILFFAGHSQTEGETGRIYINENQTNNSLTVGQLEEALTQAIENGLKLAIFNSCDGLGLAFALEKLNLPAVIVMREPVPNRVAQEFFKHFLEAFAEKRLPLYLAAQQARRKLQGLEDDFPGASWLPVICQNPAVEPATWLQLRGSPPCPYQGLFAFREENAHLFFGREQFAEDLVAAVKKKPLVAAIGASGSGKSSVLFAGTVPKLRKDTLVRWQIVSFRPGKNPFDALAAALAPSWQHLQQQGESGDGENARRLIELELAISLKQDPRALYKIIESLVQQNPGTRLILIADQFEELYTQNPESERQPFLDALLTAVRLAPAFTLALTLRADFYGYALSYRPFSDALQGAVHNLGPMNREELQSAIEKPAAQMQVRLEDGLTNKLTDATWGHPGHLPLLEFALTKLWSKQKDGWLTLEAYEEIGGVEQALANHAETVYAQLSEADRQRAQRVFLQLVRLGEETEATRRLATRDEVRSENWDLVTRLANDRLVVTDRTESAGFETVEIVHEALIRSWGRLHKWMEADGDFRRWQEQLRAAVRQWESSGSDEGALLRGKPLADAEYWQQQRLDELSDSERGFIGLSLELRSREINKQKRRRHLIISGLAGGLLLTSILAGVAWWQSQNSAKNEIKAISQSSQALLASNKELEALTEAIRAGQKLKQLAGGKAETEALAVGALQQVLYNIKQHNNLQGHQVAVDTVSFSPQGSTIATLDRGGTVKLWKSDGTLLKTLEAHKQGVTAIDFSPDGAVLATGSKDGTVTLWKSDGTLLKTWEADKKGVFAIDFSPDGAVLATGGGEKKVKLWKSDGTLLKAWKANNVIIKVRFSPKGNRIASTSLSYEAQLWKRDGTLIKTLKGHAGWVTAVDFSRDGKMIATASTDKTVKLWKPDGTLLKTFEGHGDAVWSVSFSPDSQMIATASNDKTLKLWKPDGTLLRTLLGHSDVVSEVVFSPDGHTLASSSDDRTVKLWKLGGTSLKALDHSSPVYTVGFSPDGKKIATASGYGFVTLWKQDGTSLKTDKWHNGPVSTIAFSPNNQMIVTASGDRGVKLWKSDGKFLKMLEGHTGEIEQAEVVAVSFSPDSQMFATAGRDGKVELWNSDGKLLKTLQKDGDLVWGVSFSTDGKTIATASADRTVKLWKPDGTLLKTLEGHQDAVRTVSFSPDGKILATASADKTVKLWKADGTFLKTLTEDSDVGRALAFSPDGKIIATVSADKTVKLWKSDGTLLKTFTGNSNVVRALAFSPDGKTLALASRNGPVILWNWQETLDLNRLLRYGCDWARDYLKTNANLSESDRHLCDGIKP